MPRLRPSFTRRSAREGGPLSATSLLALTLTAGVLLMPALDARQAVPPGMCRVDGRITSGGTPLPGVSLTFRVGDTAASATSSEADGRYQVVVKSGAYHLTVTFSGFAPVERDLTLVGDACGQTIDFQLTLLPRTTRTAAVGRRPAPAAGGRGVAGSQPFEAIAVQQQAAGSKDPALQTTALACCSLLRSHCGRSTHGPTTPRLPNDPRTRVGRRRRP